MGQTLEPQIYFGHRNGLPSIGELYLLLTARPAILERILRFSVKGEEKDYRNQTPELV
jgi:hypothetical protein